VLWSIDLDHLLPVDRGVRTALEGTPELLESIGWEVVEGAPSLFDADEVFRTLRAAQFFATYGNMVERTPEMFKEAIRWNVELGRALTEQQVVAARHRQREIVAMFGELFSSYDLVALPVSQVLPFAVDEEYPKSVEGVEMPDYLSWMASCYLISVTEHPALSLPIAMSETGLPVGLQLVGAPQGDLALLQAAAYLEQAVEFDGRPTLLQREAGQAKGPVSK
jgi:amidase